MTFSGLAAGGTAKIFTLTRVLVRELTADGSGTASWDGRNGSGETVASGTYFVVAQVPGGTKKFKIAVQR